MASAMQFLVNDTQLVFNNKTRKLLIVLLWSRGTAEDGIHGPGSRF